MKWGRIAGLGGAGVVLACCALIGSASAAPSPQPSYCPKQLKPCGEIVLLGEMKWDTGRVVAYGYSSGLGPCIGYANVDGGGETCGGNEPPSDGDAIQLNGVSHSSTSGRADYTEVRGLISPDVAGVRLRYTAGHNTRRVEAFVVQIDGRAQRKLKAPKPFGIFEATVPGCVKFKRFRATAFSASGQILGTSRSSGFGRECASGDGTRGTWGVEGTARFVPRGRASAP